MSSPPPLQRLLVLLVTLQCVMVATLLWRDWRGPQPQPLATSEKLTLFQRSIEDAANADADDISHLLWPLNDANPRLVRRDHKGEQQIKVAAWMSEAAYEQYYRPAQGPEGGRTPADSPRVWVTPVPQVKAFCQGLQADDKSFRLKQYLGLDPNRRYEVFVELWVAPRNLFRPCPDPAIDDNHCNLALDPHHPPQVKNIADYRVFFEQLAAQSYTKQGAPWTRLGYTYDWAHGSRGVGASEYILVPAARYYVDAAYPTERYCDASL